MPQPTSATGAPATTTSPKPKPPSPEMRRQAVPEPIAPPKPLFLCPESDCEMHTTGFPTEEARKMHVDEEHIRPHFDPLKFAEEQLAEALGLDVNGHVKAAPNPAARGGPQASAPMGASLSKQGQTPVGRAEASDTPMSRAASMNRQGSAAGGKAAPEASKGTPGKTAPGAKGSVTPRLPESRAPVAADVDMLFGTTAREDPWASATIDPQDLSTTFGFPGEMVAHGAISDFSVYRNAFTPNDTPESKEDSSGSSEPNSDISEGVNIDIGLNMWMADDSTLLEEMTKISMKPIEDVDVAEFTQAYLVDPSSMPELDGEFTAFYDKPNFELDPTLFGLETF